MVKNVVILSVNFDSTPNCYLKFSLNWFIVIPFKMYKIPLAPIINPITKIVP